MAHRPISRANTDDDLDGILDGQDNCPLIANPNQVVPPNAVCNVDLDQDHPLPKAPWNEPGARWTARRTLLHILAETSQHAGHADIIREALDGQKTMG